MKKILLLFGIISLLFSCQKDEELQVDLTGNLTVTVGGATTYKGDDIESYRVGLYDMSILNSDYFSEKEALYQGHFVKEIGSIVQFKDINPGNYVIAFVNTSKSGGDYKTTQVISNKTTIVDLLY